MPIYDFQTKTAADYIADLLSTSLTAVEVDGYWHIGDPAYENTAELSYVYPFIVIRSINAGGDPLSANPANIPNLLETLSSIMARIPSKLYLGKTAYVDIGGVIKAGAQKFQDVADPTLDQDAATKKYVDARVTSYGTTNDSALAAALERTASLETQVERLYQYFFRVNRASSIE